MKRGTIEYEKRLALVQQRRAQRARENDEEFAYILADAKTMLSDYADEDIFETVIHALWWDLRGDVPDEWWDDNVLREAYERFVEINAWWLIGAKTRITPNDRTIEGLAKLLVGALHRYSPPISEGA